MDFADAITIGKAYAKMGAAIADQAEEVINGTVNSQNFNHNALTYIQDFLGDVSEFVEDPDEMYDMIEEAERAYQDDCDADERDEDEQYS